jgi:cobalamin biosynthesis Mg chelatase CobN
MIFGLASMVCTSHAVLAQNTYNPYEPYNSQFRDYARPGGLNPFDAMPTNRSQNSTFESEMDRLIGGRETESGRSRDTDRYYNAYRKYDEQFNRLYRPNQDVDKLYNQRKSSRETVYFKALREKDPKKKADMMRAYARGENTDTMQEDMKPSSRTSSSTDKRKSSSATTKSRSGSSATRSGSSSSGRRPASSSRGLLGGSSEDDSDLDSDRTDSLTDRSGRLSEEMRPASPPRGYGSLRSREEQKKSASKPSSTGLGLPSLPGLRP